MTSASVVDRLTLHELTGAAQPAETDPKPLEGYFFGSCGAQVRSLEAEIRRLRARVAELESRLRGESP